MADAAAAELSATRHLVVYLWLAFPATPLTYLWGYLPQRDRAEAALADDDPRQQLLARYDRQARNALRFWLAGTAVIALSLLAFLAAIML